MMMKNNDDKDNPGGSQTDKTAGPLRDKRQKIRILRVAGENGTALGYAKNLSRSGMFISTLKPRKSGDEFTITFESPNGGKPITTKCRVIRSIEYNISTFQDTGMGVRFLDLSPEMEKKIEEWVKKMEEWAKNTR